MNAMPPFVQLTSAIKTIYREDAVEALGAELALLRAQRVLLVCSGSVRRSPLHARVQRQLEGVSVLQASDILYFNPRVVRDASEIRDLLEQAY